MKRPIATDGVDSPTLNASDVLISYEGCGCAGGQVTTIQSELVPRDDQPTVIARRVQKVYADILGREYKTEAMNWDGATPYTTTVQTFNGRDQATRTRQYAGTTSSTTYQDTTAEYDGFGRMISSHKPEQQAPAGTPAYTTYNHNADGSISSVTDARGASTHYAYNSRGLPTLVSYTVPINSDVFVPDDVEFTYDNAGNVTMMTDGYGTVTNEYDELSRLTAESRDLSDTLSNEPSNGIFRLEYTYGLSGHLISYSDPYGQRFEYARDRIGRIDSVTGVTSFAGVSSYALTAKYRAWGALKELSTGDGMKAETTYNDILRPDTFALRQANNALTTDQTYEYYADGSLAMLENERNENFDRLTRYDQTGNISKSLAGTLARGEVSTGYEDRPYSQEYNFTSFGQLAGRTGAYWNQNFNYTYTYVNNRVTAYTTNGASNPAKVWEYDTDGRALVSYTDFFRRSEQEYDAAGNLIKVVDHTTNNAPYSEIARHYDGRGMEIKRTGRLYDTENDEWEDQPVRYNIVSTVLKGEIISVVDETGRKLETNIFAAGRMVARQLSVYGTPTGDIRRVEWKNMDSFGLSDLRTSKYEGSSTAVGTASSPLELDPMGTELWSQLPSGSPIEPETPMEQNQSDDWINSNNPNYYNRGIGGVASPACAVGNYLMDCSTVYFADGFGNSVFGSLERAVRASVQQTGWRYRYETSRGQSRTEDLPFETSRTYLENLLAEGGTLSPLYNNWAVLPTGFVLGPTPLSGGDLKKYESEKERLLKLLGLADDDEEDWSECRKYLEEMKFDVNEIIKSIGQQVPYDAFRSLNDANEDFGIFGITVKQFFENWEAEGSSFDGAATGATGRIYYSRTGIKLSVILHEIIHSTHKGSGERKLYDPDNPKSDPMTGVVSFGPGSALILDSELQLRMGITVQGDSRNITKELETKGCK